MSFVHESAIYSAIFIKYYGLLDFNTHNSQDIERKSAEFKLQTKIHIKPKSLFLSKSDINVSLPSNKNFYLNQNYDLIGMGLFNPNWIYSSNYFFNSIFIFFPT